MAAPAWMSTTQAARSLGVSANRVRQLVETGQLPATKVGRDWVIRPHDVERYRTLPPGVKGRPRALKRGQKPARAPPF